MDSWSPPKAKRLIGALTLGLLSLLATSCGNGQPDGVADMADHGHADPRDPCTTPNAGCECPEPSRVVECGSVQRKSGGQVWCSVGHRTCSDDGSWGECEVEGLRVLPAPTNGQSTQALGVAKACLDNPCDPFCQQVVDSGSDLTDLPTGVQATPGGGITLVSKEANLNDTTCTSLQVTPPEQTFNVTQITGGTTGLLGEYFNARYGNLEVPAGSVPTATRLDQQVNFYWQDEPIAGVGGNNFTVRWTGFIKPTVTRSYQICTNSDDGVRVWLGSSTTAIINDWSAHSVTPDCATATTLTAGTLYKIRVELFEDGGQSTGQLMWKHSDAPAGELIPASVLVPPSGANVPVSFTVMPGSVQFAASALPVGCFDGPVNAVWAIDRQDRASISDNGTVTLFAPLGGDVKATAYAGLYSATGVVHVNVNVLDDTQAPSGAVTKFQNSPLGTGVDSVKVLYPYVDTVFPLALRAPTLQWDNGGTAADAVKISLSATLGGSSFVWAKVLPDANPGRYIIPQEVWTQFEASAKGKPASYTIQRITGGVVRQPVTRAIAFASAPVRGKIYYTQYARDTSVSATNMMVADPGSGAAANPVFAGDAGGTPTTRKCPVCHTVSANGTMFATSDKSFSANGGLSKINADGSFTLLSDYSNVASYKTGQDDWRGFAWAPLTPDGKYALAANNIYGNTKESLVGIDEATRTVSVPGTWLSGGNGTGLLARYFMTTDFTGWDWRRTDARVDFDWGTGSPGGPVPTAFSVAWSGQVQALTTETYTFSVRTSGGVKLFVNSATALINQPTNTLANQTFTGTVALTRGVKNDISLQFTDTGTNARARLSWSTPTIANQVIPQTQLYPNDGWHGVIANYYPSDDWTGTAYIFNRLESNIDADWGAGGPRPGGRDNNWTTTFDGRIQAPATGNIQLCVYSDDDSKLTLNGTAQTLTANCSPTLMVAQGNTYPVTLNYHENTGNASVRLTWKMAGVFAEETIPRERLLPPAAWVPPTNGLTVTYYDTDNFNATLAVGARPYASTRIEPNATLAWDNYRPEFSSNITDNDYFSARFTGLLNTTCAGIYEFQADVDDGGRLWIDGVRIVNQWAYGKSTGAVWLDMGMHDIKLDHREGDQGAYMKLSWFPHCGGATALAPIPTANLFPDGDAGTGGYVMDGGENGNGTNYFVWKTPTAAGSPSADVTADTLGRWGLDTTVMMVPSFAPDSSQLVFVDGDSAGGSGWRKGLSTFSFDQNGKVFKNRKSIASNWPNGDVIKWPAFESDSRSVIYQTTFPGDSCCRKTDWKKYGYMGPTNYFEDPGRLFSVDSKSATPTQVELKKLNQGESAFDKNKAYQPTMLPQAAGGYRWAVFTSTRPYGNTLNQTAGQQDFSNPNSFTYISEYGKLQSMLWVSAIDDTPSANADRSHPAFFLPSQNFSEDPANGYLNERAYWVTEACHPTGTDAAAACTVDEECCDAGANKGVCRIDTPATVPPTRHCFKPPSMCVAKGVACVSNIDCCDKVCDDGVCARPPALSKYTPANYSRVYTSNCAAGKKPDWTFFDYKATVPAVGGALEFYAESSDDMTTFSALPAAPAVVNIPGVALLGKQTPPGDPTIWTRITMDAPLTAASVVERKYLKITIRFVPNQDGSAAPVLTDWRQSFSCPPAE